MRIRVFRKGVGGSFRRNRKGRAGGGGADDPAKPPGRPRAEEAAGLGVQRRPPLRRFLSQGRQASPQDSRALFPGCSPWGAACRPGSPERLPSPPLTRVPSATASSPALPLTPLRRPARLARVLERGRAPQPGPPQPPVSRAQAAVRRCSRSGGYRQPLTDLAEEKEGRGGG